MLLYSMRIRIKRFTYIKEQVPSDAMPKVLKVGREGGAEVAASGAADASLLLLTMN
jgi:hypothetical protein